MSKQLLFLNGITDMAIYKLLLHKITSLRKRIMRITNNYISIFNTYFLCVCEAR
jgi:hypothetical protein